MVLDETQLILNNHSQVDTQQLSLRHRKEEVYFGTHYHHFQLSHPSTHPEADVTQHQDASNNILITTWSDSLFKALFWNFLVQRIVYL